ncbi:MAG: YiiD C-terminal domain-containing protein [Pseudomonadota bacterium]
MKNTIEQEIHQHIPLSKTMGFHIKKLTRQEILVSAPMEPNTNIHNTGFAGSIYSLGVLTAWGLIKHCLNEAGIDSLPVLSKANIQYKKPITNKITCAAFLSEEEGLLFIDKLKKQQRAKIIVKVICGENSEVVIEAHMHARI